MSNLPEKLKKVRCKLGFSLNQIATELVKKGVKITSRSIYAYETEERLPTLPYIQALIDYYDINPEWLLSNRGEMFYSENLKKSAPANVDISNMVFIPLYDMTTFTDCDYLNDNNTFTKEYISFTKSRISELTQTNEKYLIGFTNSSNSEQGNIKKSEIIIVDTKNNNLLTDGTYVVNIDNHFFVKILQRVPENKVQIASKNNDCMPFLLDFNANNFKIIGKVIWTGRNKNNY